MQTMQALSQGHTWLFVASQVGTGEGLRTPPRASVFGEAWRGECVLLDRIDIHVEVPRVDAPRVDAS